MNEILSLESLGFVIIGMILFSSISHYSKKVQFLPEVIWMLLFGILYGLSQQYFGSLDLPILSIEPSIILHLFVPVLIFAASQKICLFHFRKVLLPTSILASVGVIISMCIIAGALQLIFQIPLLIGLLFGAIISATDPLAVGAILSKNKDIPESKKLLIEGESILNDGFVVTVFGILALILFEGHDFELLISSYEFVYHILAALAIGVVCGRAVRFILRKWHEEYFTLSMNMTILLAFSSFAFAEAIHASGIIAVFAAALAYGYKPNMEKHNKDIHNHVWEYIEYLANSILFFVLGASFISQTNFADISILLLLVGFGLLVFTRAIALGVLLPFLNLEGNKFKLFDFFLLHLSGSRGAVSIALILLLPDSFEYKSFFLSFAFIIIIISLILNPLILGRLINR